MNLTLFLIVVSAYLIAAGILAIFSNQKNLKNIFPINITKTIICTRFNLKKQDKNLKISPGVTTIVLGITTLYLTFLYYMNKNDMMTKHAPIIILATLLLIIVILPLTIHKITKK